jgi:hypothetical protein
VPRKMAWAAQASGAKCPDRLLPHGSGRGPGVAVEGHEYEKKKQEWHGLCDENRVWGVLENSQKVDAHPLKGVPVVNSGYCGIFPGIILFLFHVL